ncbi:MAG: cobyric acid synthase [Lachnospiraceae bacterium]
MAKAIMIQGTMSNAGKSILVGGLCRIFQQDGYRVAPFKSQNMALNSFITDEGLEMGRAQVMQAEAAGVKPSVGMNPILLKPTGDSSSQVIVNGKVEGVMTAVQYYEKKKELFPVVKQAYECLAKEYDIIVLEGAGSPAEINLKQEDIVNMGMAKIAHAPVLLVGDIDRGGVFAQIVGTLTLLEEDERELVKGTIINKFRGDRKILEPGLRMLEDRTQVPVQGVVPYFHLDIDEEDSLTERFTKKERVGLIDIAVIRFPRISNFTDLNSLEYIEEVTVRYVATPGELGNPDMIILPGTKNTMGDLLWMRQNGLEASILKYARQKPVFGICGGYQMLGRAIADPEGVEGKGTISGMGLLPITTTFASGKTRTRVSGKVACIEGIFRELQGKQVEGYEIHMGVSTFLEEQQGLLQLTEEGKHCTKADGASKGNVYGCYVHGIFDESQVATTVVEALLREKGLDQVAVKAVSMAEYKETQYNALADIMRKNLDIKAIYDILEKGV